MLIEVVKLAKLFRLLLLGRTENKELLVPTGTTSQFHSLSNNSFLVSVV